MYEKLLGYICKNSHQTELFNAIFQYLSIQEILRLSVVAKLFNDIKLTTVTITRVYSKMQCGSPSSMRLSMLRQEMSREVKSKYLENEDPQIEKSLELCSFDEFDDFTPTHPQPKESKHRRGNSLFNSDIEAYAIEAGVYQGISLDSIKLS